MSKEQPVKRRIEKFMVLAAVAAFAAILGACGANPGTKPEDMGATDHRKHAAKEDQLAKEHQGQYNPKSQRTSGADVGGDTFSFPVTSYNPTKSHLADADQHRRHAAAHRDAADALENFEQASCGEFPPQTRKVCPLISQVASVSDIAGGVRIQFEASVNSEAALAHVRCHRAFAATRGFAGKGMDSCPMYVKGVLIEPGPSKGSVDMTVADDKLVEDLRARAAAHVTR